MTSPDVSYLPNFYDADRSLKIFEELIETVAFERPNLVVQGKTYTPLRKVAAFGDLGISYSYSSFTPKSHPWPQLLLEIKTDLEQSLECSFNHAILSLYEDGRSSIAPHRDNEQCLDPSSPVTSLSLGATRRMVFSKKGRHPITYDLENGSVLVLRDQTWAHSIPRDPDVHSARISITFRNILSPEFTVLEEGEPASKRPCPSNPVANRDLRKFSLGGNKFVSVQLFNDEVVCHIREYLMPDFRPTKSGVCMSLKTWYTLCTNIGAFSLTSSDESTVFNNSLLAIVENNELILRQIQDLRRLSNNSIVLNLSEVDALKACVGFVDTCILDYVFGEQLSSLVFDTHAPLPNSEDSKKFLDDCVNRELISVIHRLFKCTGCYFRSQSLFDHDCESFSDSMKFSTMDYSAFILTDVKAAAKDFLSHHEKMYPFDLSYLKLFEF